MIESIKKFDEIVRRSTSMGIVSHIRPDGDNLGSCSGLMESLLLMNKKVYFIDNDLIPEDFEFLKHVSNRTLLDKMPQVDLIIVLDSSNLERTGLDFEKMKEKTNLIINIDHHASNSQFGDINIVNVDATSTGEIIYRIISNSKWPISQDISTSLYTAISTDTGCFQYDSVSSETHKYISELIELGADTRLVNTSVFQSKSINKIYLLSEALKNLVFLKNNKVAITSLRKRDFVAAEASSADSEGIVEFIRNIKGVELAIFLKEETDKVKISLRSKSYINCINIASEFGGGGHIRASGATSINSLDETMSMIKNIIEGVNFD